MSTTVKNHYYIYLGKERGKRNIYKVGRTTQTCWARCKNSDYLIGLGVDIQMPPSATSWSEFVWAEEMIIKTFAKNFAKAHGNEYFKTQWSWDRIKELFMSEIISYLEQKGFTYTIHYGWVAPHTY